MLISPPFLPPRQDNETEDAWLDRCMSGYKAGQGAFPIGNNMAWHGGLHLAAPALGAGFEPVRAIADGVLLYKQPSTATRIPELKNSNNRVENDNGVIILKHATDIGTGEHASNITFYSLYMHMDTLADHLPAVGSMVYRKDVLGIAGTVDNRPRTIHFEIVCDDANLKKLLNRTSGEVALGNNGRSDAVYGENHYLLPANTPVYASKPPLHQPVPSGMTPKTHTAAGESLIISQFYACGPGHAHPSLPGTLAKAGSAYFTTRKHDGTLLGTTEAEDAEYNLYKAATDISHAFEAQHLPAAAIPAPSAVYELLRFGRVINTAHETPLPANVPNWQQIHHGSSNGDIGWVNLNTTGTRIYSDADFPGWQGWQLIQDGNTDGRCQSTTLQNLLKTTPGQTLTWDLARDHFNALLNGSLVGSAKSRQLRRVICKLDSEWDRSKVDQNTKWRTVLSDHNPAPLPPAELPQHQQRVLALCFNFPEYFAAKWHFNPREFIGHFRKCGWLDITETAKSLPKYLFYTNTMPIKAIKTNNSTYTLTKTEAISRISRHHISLMECIRKYIGPNMQRISLFLAQTLLETAQWRDLGGARRMMNEWGLGKYSEATQQQDTIPPFMAEV